MGNTRSGREIDAALRKKGFVRDTKGKHFRYFLVDRNGGCLGIDTLMSHGMMGSTVSADLLSKMARQVRLSKSQFLDLIDCPLDEEGYRKILHKQGLNI